MPSFTLPAGTHPATDLYVPVTLCNGAKGRLLITTLGDAIVESEAAFSDALCMTSLEGVAFARSASEVTPLALQNGWTSSRFGTGVAAVRDLGGIVQLAGAIQIEDGNLAHAQCFTSLDGASYAM